MYPACKQRQNNVVTMLYYFKSRKFRGQKISCFSRYLSFFAKVYAFANFKTAKRERFFTRNHRQFRKRESFFTVKKLFFKAKFSATFVKIGTTDDESDSDWVEEN